MTFKRQKTNNYFLLDTQVENIFINEYMVSAPGDYVKVYLFALMYADFEESISNEDIAKQLSMDVEDVYKAWSYWEKMGVITKKKRSPQNSLDYEVHFQLLKDKLYGSGGEEKSLAGDIPQNSPLQEKDFQQMFAEIEKIVGRTLSGTDISRILSWIDDYLIDRDVIVYAFQYGARKEISSINYIDGIIRNWIGDGMRTIEDIMNQVEAREGRQGQYRMVFKALGFSHRNPTEAEKRIMDTWFDQMSLDMETVLKACDMTTGISNPNINYVNKVLTNWHKDSASKAKATGELTRGEKMKYYELLRKIETEEAEKRREEVYSKVPRIREIGVEEQRLSAEMSKLVISNPVDIKETLEKIRETIDELNMERLFLLTDNGFELDHMEVKYSCPNCKDTGILETGEYCTCLGEITAEKIAMLKNRN